MASTNKTTNLELSQFIGSDSPKWLTDYNADMQKIDNAVGAVQSQANATDLVVSGHSSAIESLQETEGEQGTAITNLRTDVNHNTGDISTINSLIGNGEPTTTDKTIIGAINELDTDLDSKLDTPTNNAYVMTNHHAAVSSASDGTKTYGTQISELVTALKNVIDNLDDNQFLRVTGGFIHTAFNYPIFSPDYVKNNSVNTQMTTCIVNLVPNSCDFFSIWINANSPAFTSGTFGGSATDTWENEMTNIADSTAHIFYDIYTKIN